MRELILCGAFSALYVAWLSLFQEKPTVEAVCDAYRHVPNDVFLEGEYRITKYYHPECRGIEIRAHRVSGAYTCRRFRWIFIKGLPKEETDLMIE